MAPLAAERIWVTRGEWGKGGDETSCGGTGDLSAHWYAESDAGHAAVGMGLRGV